MKQKASQKFVVEIAKDAAVFRPNVIVTAGQIRRGIGTDQVFNDDCRAALKYFEAGSDSCVSAGGQFLQYQIQLYKR